MEDKENKNIDSTYPKYLSKETTSNDHDVLHDSSQKVESARNTWDKPINQSIPSNREVNTKPDSNYDEDALPTDINIQTPKEPNWKDNLDSNKQKELYEHDNEEREYHIDKDSNQREDNGGIGAAIISFFSRIFKSIFSFFFTKIYNLVGCVLFVISFILILVLFILNS